MNKQLYEAVADKTLSFGCILRYDWKYDNTEYSIIYHVIDECSCVCIQNSWVSYLHSDDPIEWKIYEYDKWSECCYTRLDNDLEILWHPIHIGHCLSWIEENVHSFHKHEDAVAELLDIWQLKRENIEHPDNEEALAYMITLIQWKSDQT